MLEGFTELGFPIADENVGLMLDVAVFLFRPSQTAAEAEAERVANEEKAMQKVLSTSNDKEMVRTNLRPDTSDVTSVRSLACGFDLSRVGAEGGRADGGGGQGEEAGADTAHGTAGGAHPLPACAAALPRGAHLCV